MKKMLFIGAMLIVGMTAFAGRGVVIGSSSDSTASGDARLGIETIGEVVDETNNVLLVVKPTISAGDDDTSLHFKFQDVKAGSGKSINGEFTVEVLNNGIPVSITKNGEAAGDLALDVQLVNGGGNKNATTITSKLKKLVTANGGSEEEIGDLTYTLDGKEENNKKLYRGTVTSNVVIDAGKSGAFRDDTAKLDITLSGLTIK